MKIYSGLDNLEINAPKKYYSYKETANYRVFSDKDNSDAFDANFAVLKGLENISESVKQVEIFHEAAGAVPLFVSAPDSVSFEDAKGALEPIGYVFTLEELCVMSTIPKASYKAIMPISCDVRVVQYLQEAEREFVLSQNGGQEYGALMLDKKLKAGAKLFIAYNSDKEPVSSCTCEGFGEALYISGVYTSEKSRKRGFARAVMCAALQYAYERSYDRVYLHTCTTKATALYEKLGFDKANTVSAWKAFKGELPEWILKNTEKAEK